MPVKISKVLRKKLPDTERDGIETSLLNKSGGVCFLCGEKFDTDLENIVADHDIPESDGGQTNLENLNLVHSPCNSFKRAHPTVEVRPYLKLTARMKSKGKPLKYDEALELLDISPERITIKLTKKKASLTLDSSTHESYPVFEEVNKEGTFKYFFAELPRSFIYNDDECQPRTIKPNHLWKIYSDISRNPLLESPACRLVKDEHITSDYKILMFDGQHKTLAFWIAGKEKIVVKVYINLTKDAAVRLVNSIQSKIKKLPLSPFELSAKMAEEWQERVEKYEEAVGTDNASEDGFIKWIEPDQKRRGKSAFEDALYQNIIDKEELDFSKLVGKPGEKKSKQFEITETIFKNKVLKPLLHIKPLKDFFPSSQGLRDREADNITKLLNIFYNLTFSKLDNNGSSPQDHIRAKRLLYQSSILYVMNILRGVFGHRLTVSSPKEFLEKDPTTNDWSLIEQDIKRLLNHPVWTAEFKTEKMISIKNSLEKNQDSKKSFEDVELKLGYVVGVDTLSSNCLD